MIVGAGAKRVVIAYLSAMVLLHAVFFWQARHPIAQRYPDFTAFYAAGLMVRNGIGEQLYDLPAQTEIERGPIGRAAELAPLPFLRPAYEVLLAVPFSFLPYLWAFAAWSVACLALLWTWIRVMRRQLPTLGDLPSFFWWLALLGFFPVFLNFPMGQDSVLLLVLLTFCFLALKKNASLTAGIWLGLAAFKPQIAVPLFLILFFGHGRVKLLAGFLAALTAVILVSAGVSGWHSVLQYPRYLLEINQRLGYGTITPLDMPNLRGLSAVFGARRLPQIAIAFLSVSLICGAGMLWIRRQDEDANFSFSMSIVVALLVGYHTHIYDLALLVLPIGLRLDWLLNRRRAAEFTAIAVLSFTPLYLVLLDHGWVNLMAVPLLLFVVSGWISSGSSARERMSPSIGI
jgi:Glycosyltransferase family 87